MVPPYASEPALYPPDSTPSPIDPRRELLKRIAGSATFQKSNRLRELLLFIGEHSLSNGSAHLREHDIGVGVFGRPENYDTSQDTLVRVQASQLRKKLQQYFEEDGIAEPLLADIPKGSYALLFHPREVTPPAAILPSPPEDPELPPGGRCPCRRPAPGHRPSRRSKLPVAPPRRFRSRRQSGRQRPLAPDLQ